MARDDFDYDEDDDGNKTVTLPADQAQGLRDKARKADELAAAASERDVAQRKLAFYESGIDMTSDFAELFVKGYDGDVNADAIKAAAAKYPGLIASTETTETTEQLTPEQEAAAKAEAEQTSARQQLSSGNPNAGVIPDRDPRELAAEAVATARKEGRSEDRALAEGFRQLVTAAANGDERVRIKGFGQ